MCLVEFVEGKLTWRTLLIYQAPPGPGSMIDKFVMDIRSYTSSVSGCTSPAAIIMIGVNCSVSLCIRYLFKLVFFPILLIAILMCGVVIFVECRC